MTGRQLSTSGFALLECLVALGILSVLTTLTFRFSFVTDESYLSFFDTITNAKTKAMLSGEHVAYEDPYQSHYEDISFNEHGNVNRAQTISFDEGGKEHEVIVELGPGCLVEK